jgi:C-terminal processing protease CtpA/Prc
MKKVIFSLNIAQKCMTALIAVLLIACVTSCDRDSDNSINLGNPNTNINDWILNNMQTYYLWNTQIPSKTNKTLFPADYFETLLYRPADRFSWIEEDFVGLQNYLSGVTTEAGYDFNLYQTQFPNVVGCITYIKPGAPAEAAGLKRGNYFQKINGTQLTTDNYSALIRETSKPHTLGISVVSDNQLTNVTEDISLQVISNYAENPILLDTIYNLDKKIGYFVYNFFARDNGDGSIAYEKELNRLFGKFKAAQIDELIVDLRYNGGGSVLTAEALASMISGQSSDKIFCTTEYNSIVSRELQLLDGVNYDKSYFIRNISRYDDDGNPVESVPINSLSGLSTVYFIVTKRSASASELLINGLKPYMNTVLVGETTYGKNVGSITLYEQDPKKQKTNRWGIQPIVMKMSNASGFSGYENGLVPDKSLSEYAEGVILRQLGDTEEVLLKATINRILNRDATVATTRQIDSRAVFVGSTMDKTPARRNMYITPKDLDRKRTERTE